MQTEEEDRVEKDKEENDPIEQVRLHHVSAADSGKNCQTRIFERFDNIDSAVIIHSESNAA